MNRECLQCGNTEYLITIGNDKLACKDCLDALGKEQLEIKDKIVKLLLEYPSLKDVKNQIKALEAIALYMKIENGDI